MKLKGAEIQILLDYYYNTIDYFEHRLKSIEKSAIQVIDDDLFDIQRDRIQNKIDEYRIRIRELNELAKED